MNIEKGLAWDSANRYGKTLKAALALAKRKDKRIVNENAWKEGLRPRKVKGHNAPPRDNYYLSDPIVLAIVRGCYAEGDDFGALVEVLAGTARGKVRRSSCGPAISATTTRPRRGS